MWERTPDWIPIMASLLQNDHHMRSKYN